MDQAKNNSTDVDAGAAFDAARGWLGERLIGRAALIDRLMIALLTGGHVLIEGAPGLAKTRAVRLFAQCVSADFVRIQATPDLLPADLTGTTVFRPETGTFEFVEGPLFSNVVLVDEVNRAPPKVQSALLEAMGEGQITAGGQLLAYSVSTGGRFRFLRVYPDPLVYAPVTGFYSLSYSSTGLERAEDSILNGSDQRLFARRLAAEMAALEGDTGAKRLIGAHEDEVCEVETDSGVLLDIDTPEALTRFKDA